MIQLDNELRFLSKWAQEESETECWRLPAHHLQIRHALPSIEIIKRIRARLDAAKIPDGELTGLYDGQAVEWPWVSQISEAAPQHIDSPRMNAEVVMAEFATRIMYHVEKFLPPECPKCRARFQHEGKDYVRLLGDIINGTKTIRETSGYRIIVCSHCENVTACWPLETYQVGDKKKAQALVKDKGFVNLIQVEATGSMTQDAHAICGKVPDLRVESIKCEEETDEPFVTER